MSFFKASFKNFGEALKTISLAIAILGVMMSGIGYVYGTLSAQRAMATELRSTVNRVDTIEHDRKDVELWKFRVEQSEKGIVAANEKLDRVEQVLNDVRVTIESRVKR